MLKKGLAWETLVKIILVLVVMVTVIVAYMTYSGKSFGIFGKNIQAANATSDAGTQAFARTIPCETNDDCISICQKLCNKEFPTALCKDDFCECICQ